MRHIDWQLERFASEPGATAIIWRDHEYSYGDLHHRVLTWEKTLADQSVSAGDSVGVLGDYSPESIACLLALLKLRAILVPVARDSADQHESFFRTAELDRLITIDEEDGFELTEPGLRANHDLFAQLREADTTGLVLFSSGSTGEPKGIVHNLEALLAKFQTPRHRFRTINFLLFDHIGGVNTMFYTLSNLGCTIVPRDRSVASVCKAIARHEVELLPTSPSFLNLLLLEAGAEKFDLSSLKVVTYGTEVMSERTLAAAVKVLPRVRFQQTYGLSEVGILRSKSRSNESLMVKIGGEDYETKVVDDRLFIRSRTSMLGYLNAPSPFDEDGWLDTGDSVIQEGDYYRILGRESDIINVGGQKVYPAEVEKVLSELPGVIEAVVSGEAHLLLGQIVVATLQMEEEVPTAEIRRKVGEHCRGRLQQYMIPQKVRVIRESPLNYRFKKVRQ